jgi:hypothetical protein
MYDKKKKLTFWVTTVALLIALNPATQLKAERIIETERTKLEKMIIQIRNQQGTYCVYQKLKWQWLQVLLKQLKPLTKRLCQTD